MAFENSNNGSDSNDKTSQQCKIGKLKQIWKLLIKFSKEDSCLFVAQEAIFLEQNMRFWLILGRLAILKKMFLPIKSNFQGQGPH